MLRSTFPSRAVRGAGAAALLALGGCARVPPASSNSAAWLGTFGPRERAAQEAALPCVLAALPAGFAVVPGPRGMRAERAVTVAKGERFERLLIGAVPVPGRDSVLVRVQPMSGTYLDATGGYTLDEPSRVSTQRAAAGVQEACGRLEAALPPA